MELLRQCGWLSVRQLVYYHSVVQVHKTIITKFPKYIYRKLSLDFPYSTRLAESASVRRGPQFQERLDLTEKSFMNRGTKYYNQLPADLRKVEKMETLKIKLKAWIQEHIEI